MARSTLATYCGLAQVDSSYANFRTSGEAWSYSPGMALTNGPDECECEAPIRIEPSGMPVRSRIARRAATTMSRRTPRPSTPTIATLDRPSSKTEARTLHGSWIDLWYDLPYPPGASMPTSGVMSRSANPALKSARGC